MGCVCVWVGLWLWNKSVKYFNWELVMCGGGGGTGDFIANWTSNWSNQNSNSFDWKNLNFTVVCHWCNLVHDDLATFKIHWLKVSPPHHQCLEIFLGNFLSSNGKSIKVPRCQMAKKKLKTMKKIQFFSHVGGVWWFGGFLFYKYSTKIHTPLVLKYSIL